MLNWIVWNRNVLTFNCVGTKTILILNWIVWIRTIRLRWVLEKEMFLTSNVYLDLNCVLMLNWIVWNETVFVC